MYLDLSFLLILCSFSCAVSIFSFSFVLPYRTIWTLSCFKSFLELYSVYIKSYLLKILFSKPAQLPKNQCIHLCVKVFT